MLNSRLKEHEVIIQCIPYGDNEIILLNFISILKKVLAEEFYENRDELDEFEVDETVVNKILNPVDRSYHAYEFVKQHGLLNNFQNLLNAISLEIIESPGSFKEEADKAFKERRKEQNNIKKIDIYEEIFDLRFNESNEYRNTLKNWFSKLQEEIYEDLKDLWTFSENRNFIVCDSIKSKANVYELMEKLYSKNSACSLIFEEVCYATSPSQKFVERFVKRDLNISGRRLKLNILDTFYLFSD